LSGSDAIDLLALVCDEVIPSRWCYNWTEYAESKLGISQNVIDELFCAYGYVSACADGGSVTPGISDKPLAREEARRSGLPRTSPSWRRLQRNASALS